MDYKIYRTPCNAAGYIVDSDQYGRYAIEAYCPQLIDTGFDCFPCHSAQLTDAMDADFENCPWKNECEYALANPATVVSVIGWDEADKLLDQDELAEAQKGEL